MASLPASEFPETIAAIQALGATDAERAKALDFKSTKTIERLRKFIPSTLVRILDSPHAVTILQAMLSDVERRRSSPS